MKSSSSTGGKFNNFFLFLFLRKKMLMAAYYEENPYLRLYSRAEIEKKYDQIGERTMVCSKCKKCIYCEYFQLIQFEFERKGFWSLNKDVEDWEIRYQKGTIRLVICKFI